MTDDRTQHHTINYIELPATGASGVSTTVQFYQAVFGWEYQLWGPEYADTASSGVSCGINGGDHHSTSAPLPVIYSDDLEATRAAVIASGGVITLDIFAFPGGRRFHFTDPVGNLMAAWSAN